MTSIDVTQNSQYITTKQSYDDQIATDDKVKDLQAKQAQYAATHPTYFDSEEQQPITPHNPYDDQLAQIDPDGSIRKKLGSDPDAVIGKLTAQENEALGHLAATLQGDQVVADINDLLANSKPDPHLDVFLRVFLVFQKSGNSADDTGQSFIDDMSDKADTSETLDKLLPEVGNKRPNGSSTDAKGTIAGSVIDGLDQAGVDLPRNEMTKNSDGTYTMSQSTFDKITNNIKSRQSSLATMQQSGQTQMQGILDFVKECRDLQSQVLKMKSTSQGDIVGNMRA
jgi:hypothetical protein